MTTKEIVAAIQERAEVARGYRCPYCRTRWDERATPGACCRPMRQELARLEAVFWGPLEPLAVDAIKQWLEPAALSIPEADWRLEPLADEPLVVRGDGS